MHYVARNNSGNRLRLFKYQFDVRSGDNTDGGGGVRNSTNSEKRNGKKHSFAI